MTGLLFPQPVSDTSVRSNQLDKRKEEKGEKKKKMKKGDGSYHQADPGHFPLPCRLIDRRKKEKKEKRKRRRKKAVHRAGPSRRLASALAYHRPEGKKRKNAQRGPALSPCHTRIDRIEKREEKEKKKRKKERRQTARSLHLL